MPVVVSLHLFGKPSWELGEGEDVTPARLRILAEKLRSRLVRAAHVLDKLGPRGWDVQQMGCGLELFPPEIVTRQLAEQILRDLGTGPDEVSVNDLDVALDEGE
jgi:hypothetical protein